MIRDVYTTADAYEVLQEIDFVIKEDMKGILIDPKVNQIFEHGISGDNEEEDGDENKEEKEEQGPGEIDIDHFCLTATIAHMKTDENEENEQQQSTEFEGTKIHVQLYWDEDRQCTLVQLNIISQQNPQKPMDFWDRKNLISMWKKLKNAFLTKAGHVLTGLPEQEKENVDDAVKDLYAKCFPKPAVSEEQHQQPLYMQ